jgi:hypothetical protein
MDLIVNDTLRSYPRLQRSSCSHAGGTLPYLI